MAASYVNFYISNEGSSFHNLGMKMTKGQWRFCRSVFLKEGFIPLMPEPSLSAVEIFTVLPSRFPEKISDPDAENF